MAYDEELANRIRELLGARKGVEEKRMFGGLLMVRVPPDETGVLVGRDHVEPMVMGGRETRGWVRVSVEGVATTRQQRSWVGRSVGYAEALPPK